MSDDSCTAFSVLLPYTTPAQQQWLVDNLSHQELSESGEYCDYEEQPTENTFWLHSTDGNINGVTDLVARFQDSFQILTPWLISWAKISHRLIVHGFSGGTAIVSKGHIHPFEPERLAEQWLRNHPSPQPTGTPHNPTQTR